MIHNIKELQEFILKKGEEFKDPLFKQSFMFTSQGCSVERVEYLKKEIPKLPESYTRFLTKLNLNGIEIGNFSLSPFGKNPVDIVEDLIEAYKDPILDHNFMTHHNMYKIGFCSTDFICVTAGTDNFKNGEILYVEVGCDAHNMNDDKVHKLARDFEQFLLMAGNAYQIWCEMNASSFDDRFKEFLDRLKILKVSEEYYWMWPDFL